MKQRSLILLALALLFVSSACTVEKEKPKAKTAIPVTVARVQRRDVPLQIKAIGNIEAYRTVAIKAQVDGQIARIYFPEGSDVEKGALLISIDPAPFQASLSQAEAALARDQAQEKFAQEQAGRYQGLLQEGIVTRDQYDQLRSNAEAFSATVAADQAAIRKARIELGYCSIRSPLSGRTGAIALSAGNLVKANDLAIVTVNQLRPIYATFAIPERRLAEVQRARAGKELTIATVIPQEGGVTESGTISFLDNAVNAATGTIKLKGVFANSAGKLWPGQFIEVVMTLGMRKESLVVPSRALQNSQQGEFVYVVKADQTVEMRPVTPAFSTGEETVIEKGLAAGEIVVVDGQLRLSPGAAVTSAASRPAPGKAE